MDEYCGFKSLDLLLYLCFSHLFLKLLWPKEVRMWIKNFTPALQGKPAPRVRLSAFCHHLGPGCHQGGSVSREADLGTLPLAITPRPHACLCSDGTVQGSKLPGLNLCFLVCCHRHQYSTGPMSQLKGNENKQNGLV